MMKVTQQQQDKKMRGNELCVDGAANQAFNLHLHRYLLPFLLSCFFSSSSHFSFLLLLNHHPAHNQNFQFSLPLSLSRPFQKLRRQENMTTTFLLLFFSLLLVIITASTMASIRHHYYFCRPRQKKTT
jgi:hypothetical protein